MAGFGDLPVGDSTAFGGQAVSGSQTSAPTKAKGPGGVKGFLLNSLPTIGGVTGGILGLPLNALDAVSGVGGTALDLGLAGAGSAAGEALKEKLSGQKLSAGNIAGQGALGAVGEGAGQVIGHVGAAVLPKVLGNGTSPIADALNNSASKNVAGQIASNLPPGSVKSASDLGRLTGQGDLMSSLGLFNGASRSKAADLVTGDTGFVNGVKQSILTNAGHVPVPTTRDAVQNAITQNGVSGDAEKKAIENAVDAQLKKAAPSGELRYGETLAGKAGTSSQGGLEAQTIKASDLFKAQQALEKLSATERGKNNLNVANAYKDIAGHLGEQIDNHTNVNGLVDNFTVPEDMARDISEQATKSLGKKTGSKVASYITDAVNGAKSLPALRAIEADFIPARQAATNAEIKGLQKGGSSVAGNVAGAAVSPFGKLSLARQLVGKVAPTEAKIASGVAGTIAPVEKSLPGLLQRLVGQHEVRAHVANPNQIQTAQDAGAPQLGGALGSGGTPGIAGETESDAGNTDDTDSSSSSSVFSPAVLQALAIRDLEENGGKNLSQIATLDSLFGPKNQTSSSSDTVKPTSQQLGEAQSGEESLQSLEGIIGQNPGIVNKTAVPGQGLPIVGGLVKRIAGTGDYQAAASNTLDALARARTGAAMSKSEQAFYQKLLPQAGDSSETIQYKLSQLESAFKPFLSTQNVGQ